MEAPTAAAAALLLFFPPTAVADFDDTIKIGAGDVGRDSKWVVRECLRRNYGIAIATAGCQRDYVHRWLKRFDPAVFTGARKRTAESTRMILVAR